MELSEQNNHGMKNEVEVEVEKLKTRRRDHHHKKWGKKEEKKKRKTRDAVFSGHQTA